MTKGHIESILVQEIKHLSMCQTSDMIRLHGSIVVNENTLAISIAHAAALQTRSLLRRKEDPRGAVIGKQNMSDQIRSDQIRLSAGVAAAGELEFLLPAWIEAWLTGWL